MTWGWRIPFLISIFIAFFAIFLRRSMQESPVFTAFKERKKREQESVVEAGLDAHEGGWRAFFVMLGLRIGENGPSYIAQSFLVGYVVKALAMEKAVPTTAVLVASFLGFPSSPSPGGSRIVSVAASRTVSSAHSWFSTLSRPLLFCNLKTRGSSAALLLSVWDWGRWASSVFKRPAASNFSAFSTATHEWLLPRNSAQSSRVVPLRWSPRRSLQPSIRGSRWQPTLRLQPSSALRPLSLLPRPAAATSLSLRTQSNTSQRSE